MTLNTTQPLHSNNPILKLSADNDAFGVLDKANFISELLLSGDEILGQNKMIVLYGGWGSGKSSMMLHIKEQLELNGFPVIFFEAWKFEKDENLALSLVASISSFLSTKQASRFKKISRSVFGKLTTFTKFIVNSGSIDVSIPIGTDTQSPSQSKPSVNLKFNAKEGFKALEAENEKQEKAFSAFDRYIKFEASFRAVEKEILKSRQKKKLVIFIDDLDRCEPEHTLELLTAIKLFFTYGENTIFVCGVDKEAIKTALLTKYNDNVKADEYLEKVFDISFTMPEPVSVAKLIGLTLTDIPSADTIKFIGEFFKAIGFTNARHIKKVLNKFELLKKIRDNYIGSELGYLIPSNLHCDKWEIIFTLYFIILYEFHKDKFEELENWDEKISNYALVYLDKSRTEAGSHSFETSINYVNSFCPNRDSICLNQITKSDSRSIIKLLLLFSPKYCESKLEFTDLVDRIPQFLAAFNSVENRVLIKFCEFLREKIKQEEKMDSTSGYLIWNYFNMARIML